MDLFFKRVKPNEYDSVFNEIVNCGILHAKMLPEYVVKPQILPSVRNLISDVYRIQRLNSSIVALVIIEKIRDEDTGIVSAYRPLVLLRSADLSVDDVRLLISCILDVVVLHSDKTLKTMSHSESKFHITLWSVLGFKYNELIPLGQVIRKLGYSPINPSAEALSMTLDCDVEEQYDILRDISFSKTLCDTSGLVNSLLDVMYE